jgi:hypothetical protein
MEEDVLDIQLVHGPAPREGQSQHGGGLCHGPKSLIVVHTEALDEPSEDPMSSIPVQRTIRLELVLEDPLVNQHWLQRIMVRPGNWP